MGVYRLFNHIALVHDLPRCSLLVFECAAFQQLFRADRNVLAEILIKIMRQGCALKTANS